MRVLHPVVTNKRSRESYSQMEAKTTPAAAGANIDTVARLEQEFLNQRTLADRIGDAVVAFMGTMTFVVGHFVLFLLWITINGGKIPGIRPFDPFPFVLLTMIVSMEGVLLAAFILMKQNRMSKRADQRDHLHLQINLLAEQEVTKMLQMQREICKHLGIRHVLDDRQTTEFASDTAVEHLARELEQKLPE